MDDSLEELAAAPVAVIALVMIVGGIVVWGYILRCLLLRRSIVAFEPRRQVPWNGLDVLLVAIVYVLIGSTLAFAAQELLGWRLTPPDAVATSDQPAAMPEAEVAGDDTEADDGPDLERSHALVVLLAGESSSAVFLLCMVTAVIVAPVTEEFLFRLLMQGFFEKVDFGCRRVLRYSGKLVGLGPIVFTSLLFASMHARPVGAPDPAEYLIRGMALHALASTSAVVLGVVYLMRVRRATWQDLGVRLDMLPKDLGLAITTFLAVVVPVAIMQQVLAWAFPNMVPDPIPLFFLAVALGYLYFRTHRVMPAILLHMIFNGMSLAVFLVLMAGNQ
jgi:membrane protease YdiL (CAAX protease family)